MEIGRDAERVDARAEAVAVVIHWGEADRTLALVRALGGQPVFDRIVVVANDGRQRPPEADSGPDTPVDWLVPPRNLGYGAACQLAADSVAAGKYAFLNNDLVLSCDAAAKCLDALDLPGVGITGPVLLHPDGRLQSGCGSFSRWLPAPRAEGWPDRPVALCGWVTGAALFARGEVVHGVRFDGSYFLGYEDSDLCERAAAAGWATACLAGAVGEHEGSTTISVSRWQYYSIRNRIWFCRRRRSAAVAVTVRLWMALVMLPRVALADVVKRRGHDRVRSVLQAVVDGWGPLPAFGEVRPDEPVPRRWLSW